MWLLIVILLIYFMGLPWPLYFVAVAAQIYADW